MEGFEGHLEGKTRENIREAQANRERKKREAKNKSERQTSEKQDGSKRSKIEA